VFRGVHRPPSRSQTRSARYPSRSCLCGQTRGTEAGPSIAGILAWQRDAFLQLCIFHLASSPKLTLAYWQAWQSSEGASLQQPRLSCAYSASETWLVSEMLCHEEGLSCVTRHMPSVLDLESPLFPTATLHFTLRSPRSPHSKPRTPQFSCMGLSMDIKCKRLWLASFDT
jgi:hypothetical protein